jgi:hypothetical protein
MFYKTMPILICVLGFLLAPATSHTQTTTLPLESPPAPFDEALPRVVRRFPPEIVGNSIVSGSKKLEISSKEIFLTENGRVVARACLFFYAKEKNHGLEEKTSWFKIDDQLWFDKDKSRFFRDGQKFVYKGEIHRQDAGGTVCQTIELLEQGGIRFDFDIHLKGCDNIELGVSSYWFYFDYSRFTNKRLRYLDKEYIVNDDLKWDSMHIQSPISKIDFFPENANEHFSILPLTARNLSSRCYVTTWDRPVYNFRLIPGQAKECQFSFELDLCESMEPEEGQTLAGINFKAIDDLMLPDYGSTRNLIQNPSLEQGLNYFQSTAQTNYLELVATNWQLQPHQIEHGFAKHGRKCLKLLTRKKSANQAKGDYRTLGYRLRLFSIPLDAGEYTFSFYAKGTEGKNARGSIWFPNSPWVGHGNMYLPIGFRVDGKGKEARELFYVNSSEWKRFSFTIHVPQSMPVHPNLGVETEDGDSYVWMDCFQLEKGSVATDFVPPIAESMLLTSQEDNFLSQSDRIDARLAIYSAPETIGKIKVAVKDFYSKILFDRVYDFACDNTGETTVQLDFDHKFPNGIFVMKTEFELANGQKTFQYHRFSIMDFLDNTHRLKNIFADSYHGHYERYDFPKMLERLKRVGIGATNHTHLWDKVIWDAYRKYGIEPTDAFMASDIRPYFHVESKLVGFALRNPRHPGYGMRSDDPHILLCDYHHEGYGAPTPEYLDKFRTAVAKIAKANSHIKLWAFQGEVFARFSPTWLSNNKAGTSEEGYRNFAKILQAFYQGIKQGNPDALVFQDDPCNMSPEQGIAETDRLLAACNEIGGFKFDMIGMHPYRQSPESPDLDNDTQALFAVLKKNNYENTPIFWPEAMHYGPYTIPQWGIESARWLPPGCWYGGTLSYDMGWTEKISAAWRARSWLVALKYQDRVKSMQSSSDKNNFIMDRNLTPFATQKISNTLGQLLGDAEFKKDVRFAPYVRCYVFEDTQKRPVAALWCHHPKLDAGAMLAPVAEANFDGSLQQIFDLMQVERSFIVKEDGKVEFPVSSFPLFLRGKAGTVDKFIMAMNNASLISGEGISPLLVHCKPASPDKAVVQVTNFLSKEFSGTITNGDEKIGLTVPPTAIANSKITFPIPLRNDAITTANLPLTIKSGENAFGNQIEFDAFVCLKAKTEITIDGDLSDWRDIPAIPITKRVIGDRTVKSISDSDFSGSFRVAWNEKGIYICAEITDDKFVHVEDSPFYVNDSMQIYFDSFCDARAKQQLGYDENDYDYAVYPNSDGTRSVVYRQLTPDPQLGLATQAPRDKTIAEDIPSAFKRTADGYIYEVFFPEKYLLPIRLEKGYALGFGLFINDRDDPSEEAQRLHRPKSSLTLASDGQGCYNRPHTWPAMLLWE